MTPIEFKRLSLNDRARVVLKRAKFVVTVNYYNYQNDLYSLDGFFIEVKLTPITNELESIHVAEEHDLEKYVNDIDLPAL